MGVLGGLGDLYSIGLFSGLLYFPPLLNYIYCKICKLSSASQEKASMYFHNSITVADFQPHSHLPYLKPGCSTFSENATIELDVVKAANPLTLSAAGCT